MSLSTYLPIAPFYGIGFTPGVVTGPGVIQLLNPSGSGITAVVYEITLMTPIELQNAFQPASVRVRRAVTSVMTRGAGASESIYTTFRPDYSFTSASSCSFTAFNFTSNGSIFLDNQSFWWGLPPAEGNQGWQPTVIRPGFNGFPLTLQPGSALEVQANAQGVGNKIKATVLWTEEP